MTRASASSQSSCLKCIVDATPSGQPLPPEMTLAQLLTLLYDRKLPQGYQSINLTVKLGSKVISDAGLSKTDSFKRLRTEKGTETSVPPIQLWLNGSLSEKGVVAVLLCWKVCRVHITANQSRSLQIPVTHV